MALLGWLLCRRGRRIIMPDLFDFDHGLSASDKEKTGEEVVMDPASYTEALMCVLRELLSEGCKSFDVAGHSFGGYLAARLSERCEKEGLPIRKSVMLGPGGPFIINNPSPQAARFINCPMETIDELLPWWVPSSPFKYVARCALGVLLSPNNCSLMFGMRYRDYFGIPLRGTQCPMLLLWGDEDDVAVPRRAPDLGRYLKARYVHLDAFWVQGGSHNIQLDRAVATARFMDAWLRTGDCENSRSHGPTEKLLGIATDSRVERMDFDMAGQPSHSTQPVTVQSRL